MSRPIFFGLDLPWFTDSLRGGLYRLEKRGINDGGGWLTIFVSIIVTAGFIPNMLGKSTLDLYISKPITRVELLLYKYLGGMIFVFLLTSVTVTSIWIVIGLRSGIWTPHLLAMIPMVTFYFAILYSISTLIAVLTRSSLLAILAPQLSGASRSGSAGWKTRSRGSNTCKWN